MTSALVSITSPARSDVSVTGTYDLNVPLNAAAVTNKKATIAVSKISVHHALAMRCVPALRFMPLASQVEVAGLSINGQRHDHDQDGRDDHRGTHGPTNGLTHARGPATGRVAVVGAQQHDHQSNSGHLAQR